MVRPSQATLFEFRRVGKFNVENPDICFSITASFTVKFNLRVNVMTVRLAILSKSFGQV
jgi:hypothetical protein